MLGLTAAVPSLSSVSAVPMFRIHGAADLLAVSDDTVRRWADSGRFATTTDHVGRKSIEGAVLARFAEEPAVSSSAPTAPSTSSPPPP